MFGLFVDPQVCHRVERVATDVAHMVLALMHRLDVRRQAFPYYKNFVARIARVCRSAVAVLRSLVCV
jgi:hypothetical protein